MHRCIGPDSSAKGLPGESGPWGRGPGRSLGVCSGGPRGRPPAVHADVWAGRGWRELSPPLGSRRSREPKPRSCVSLSVCVETGSCHGPWGLHPNPPAARPCPHSSTAPSSPRVLTSENRWEIATRQVPIPDCIPTSPPALPSPSHGHASIPGPPFTGGPSGSLPKA